MGGEYAFQAFRNAFCWVGGGGGGFPRAAKTEGGGGGGGGGGGNAFSRPSKTHFAGLRKQSKKIDLLKAESIPFGTCIIDGLQIQTPPNHKQDEYGAASKWHSSPKPEPFWSENAFLLRRSILCVFLRVAACCAPARVETSAIFLGSQDA